MSRVARNRKESVMLHSPIMADFKPPRRFLQGRLTYWVAGLSFSWGVVYALRDTIGLTISPDANQGVLTALASLGAFALRRGMRKDYD